MSNTHKIGWIGLGRMGEAMAIRLLKNGCDVSVWNRTAAKAEPLKPYGAKIVAGKTDLADRDIVFTMVSTTADLKEVLFEAGGLLSGSAKPDMVVDCSSISQEGSAEVRAELEKRGIAYAGAVGYFGADGSVDTCIVLRTACFKDGIMHIQAGGGVVADSDADAEYDETLHKARALRRAAEETWRFV
jgi:6-phosphogluconate dehydrogenase (decarboxylating)